MGRDQEKDEYGENLLRRAEAAYTNAKEQMEEYGPSYAKVVTDSLESLELSVKSIIVFLKGKLPEKWRKHWFGKEIRADILKELDLPEAWPDRKKFPRILFRTEFWYTFYETSKYGDEESLLGPEELVEERDAENALKDSEESIRAARTLRDLKFIKKVY